MKGGNEMDYDGIFLFHPSLEKPILDEKIVKILKTIRENGGELLEENHWGKMSLSYPIKREKSGYYWVARISGSPQMLQKLKDALKYEESILRHLFTRSEGVPLHTIENSKGPHG